MRLHLSIDHICKLFSVHFSRNKYCIHFSMSFAKLHKKIRNKHQLNDVYKKKRVAWIKMWKNVIFTDEKNFYAFATSVIYFWRSTFCTLRVREMTLFSSVFVSKILTYCARCKKLTELFPCVLFVFYKDDLLCSIKYSNCRIYYWNKCSSQVC